MNIKNTWAGMPSNKKMGIILVICMSVAVVAVSVFYTWDYFKSPEGISDETTTTQVTTTRKQIQKAIIERFAKEMIAYGKAQGLAFYDPDSFDQSIGNPQGTKRERSAVQMPFRAENIPEGSAWTQTIESIFQSSEDYILRMNNTPLPYFSVTFTDFDVYIHRDWQ